MKVSLKLLMISAILGLLSGCGAPLTIPTDKHGKKLHILPPLSALKNDPLPASEFQAQVNRSLQEFLPSSRMALRFETLETSANSEKLSLTVGGIPLCEYHATATVWGNQSQILGNIPTILHSDEVLPFSDIDDAKEDLKQHLENSEDITVGDVVGSKCLLIREGLFVSAWKFTFKVGDLPYEAYWDSQGISNLHARYYHASAKAKIFNQNSLSNEFMTVDLDDLDDSGKLNGKYIWTVLPTSSGSTSRALSSNGLFDFSSDPSSWEFWETSVYANTDITIDWLIKIGYNMPSEKVRIVPGISIQGDPNNALYAPTQLGEPTSIYIGKGDGRILQNLTTDGDVVAHEYGHHIVFQSVSQMGSTESIALHEGLADFLTFARTSDACLGESICPSSSRSICSKCLRSGSNQYGIADRRALAEPHLQGQIVSGTLWALKTKGNLSGEDVGKLTLTAISMLPANADFEDFGVALIRAVAKESSNLCSQLKEIYSERSWDTLVTAEIACSGDNSIDLNKTVDNGLEFSEETSTNSPDVVSSSGESRKTSTKTGPCGVVGSLNKGDTMQHWLILLVLMLPLAFLALAPTPARQEQEQIKNKIRRRPSKRV